MIRLICLVLLWATTATAQSAFVGPLDRAGRIDLSYDTETFGGLSAIYVDPDGSFLVVSDRGHYFVGVITRRDGKLATATIVADGPILDTKGNPLDGLNTDAEGIAFGPEGVYISFEGNHRIMLHSDIRSAATFLPKHPDFRGLINNSGLEALAIDASGALYAIPERSGKLDRAFPIYRYDGTWTKSMEIPRVGDFLVTGADFGPDGRLYVLERKFQWLGGFSTRIRRFTIVDGQIVGEEKLLETIKGTLDNMEGISVWRDESGQTRITLISDDNFNLLQHTMLVEYIVPF